MCKVLKPLISVNLKVIYITHFIYIVYLGPYISGANVTASEVINKDTLPTGEYSLLYEHQTTLQKVTRNRQIKTNYYKFDYCFNEHLLFLR